MINHSGVLCQVKTKTTLEMIIPSTIDSNVSNAITLSLKYKVSCYSSVSAYFIKGNCGIPANYDS